MDNSEYLYIVPFSLIVTLKVILFLVSPVVACFVISFSVDSDSLKSNLYYK